MKKILLAALCLGAVSSLTAAPQPINEGEWDWKAATELGVRGRGFADAEPYARLPKRADGVVPQKVFRMGRHSTGLYVDFATDSDRIAVIWELADASGVDPQISPSGLYGVDVYAKAPGGDDWRFVSIGQVRSSKKGPLHSELTLKWTPGATGRVYLPMRGDTSSLRIGVRKGRSLVAGPKQRLRVVHYGTSLVHGGCVDRAGMVFTSIYGRLADAEVVNLGFSGAAKLESEMVAFVAEPEADVYVVDPALNNSAAELTQKLPPFVRALAGLRPDKPIIVCEPANTFMPETDRTLAMRKVVDGLRTEGLKLQTIRTDELIAPDGEGTVDGIHPNAYGAMQMGRAFASKIVTAAFAGQKSSPLQFMTFNIWGDYFDNPVSEREAGVEETILTAKPDVVALQEVTPGWYKSPMFANLEKTGYVIVRGDEDAALKRAACAGKRSARHICHEPILYRADRLKMLDSGTDFFHLSLDPSKSVTWAVLEDKKGGRRFVAFATHFWWQSNGRESDAIRELNARHILSLLADIRRKWGPHLPAVLGGDLNSRTKSSAHEMLRQGGFMNADATADIRSAHSSHHGNPRRGEDGKYHGSLRTVKDDNPSTSIDHVYYTEGVHAIRHEIITDQSALDVSDHSPVLVEFAIEK